MSTFAYRATTAAGRTVSGREDALSVGALERSLGERGLLVLEVTPVAAAAPGRRRQLRGRRADVVETVRYLATLMDSTFPLDRALNAVARVAARADVAAALRAVREQVQSGRPLADALASHPDFFPKLAIGMVRAGERGGHLAESLGRLAEQLEREQKLRARLWSALLYPLVLAVVGGLALATLLVYVLPRFIAVLNEAGAALPRSTALLLQTADFVGRWWMPLLLAPVVLALLVSWYYRTPAGRLALDGLLLDLPLVGPLRSRVAAVRLGRTLSTLLAGGMPVLPALEVSAEALGDEAAAQEVRRAREEVRTGGRLAPALGRGRAFPDLFTQMVEVGEEGGRLPEMLERAAATLEDDLERNLDRVVRLAEPAMIVLFGGAVGFVALALLQAIYGIQPDSMLNP